MVRGQFKIQQTIFMILAVVLFFILVFLFWIAIKYQSLREDAANLEQNKAVLLAEFLSGTTEFSCADTQYCVDTDKILMIKNISSYNDLWDVNYIKIIKLSSSTKAECTPSSYPECDTFTLFKKRDVGTSAQGSFVALCRYERVDSTPKRICELGRLMVGYEIK